MALPEPISTDDLKAYSGSGIDVKDHRYRRQTEMGVWVAIAILATLCIAVGLVAYLAIDHRAEKYIASVGQTLQPFVLPTLGALVGYALRAAQDKDP
jgi:uncharacterized membrane protein